jgi:hypothetical protein
MRDLGCPEMLHAVVLPDSKPPYEGSWKLKTTLLGRLFELVPNIDPDRSAMVGFSNGALTIAVLVSNHDEFVLSHLPGWNGDGQPHRTDLARGRLLF